MNTIMNVGFATDKAFEIIKQRGDTSEAYEIYSRRLVAIAEAIYQNNPRASREVLEMAQDATMTCAKLRAAGL